MRHINANKISNFRQNFRREENTKRDTLIDLCR